jgi:hypothetical protein
VATYSELVTASEDPGLRVRVRAAITIAAEAVRAEAGGTTNHAKRMIWARAALLSPEQYEVPFLKAAIASNSGATLANITSVSDANLQTAINNWINVFAGE